MNKNDSNMIGFFSICCSMVSKRNWYLLYVVQCIQILCLLACLFPVFYKHRVLIWNRKLSLFPLLVKVILFARDCSFSD